MRDESLIQELEALLAKAKAGEKIRTPRQNNSLHKYLELRSEALNQAGLDMRVVLKPDVSISWNTANAKENLWRPVMKAVTGKESTTELTTQEITKVHEFIERHLGEKFGVEYIPWPSNEPPHPGLE